MNATEKAMELGNAIFANIIMIGALSVLCLLPFSREDFVEVVAATLPPDRVNINIEAFDTGTALLAALNDGGLQENRSTIPAFPEAEIRPKKGKKTGNFRR